MESERILISATSVQPPFYFVKIKDSSAYLVDYAAFAKDKSLKGEFIRTVMGRAELPEEDKATVIHYGLQALAGEEILDA